MGETERMTAEAISNAIQGAVDAMAQAEAEIRRLNEQIRQLEAERDQWQKQAMANG